MSQNGQGGYGPFDGNQTGGRPGDRTWPGAGTGADGAHEATRAPGAGPAYGGGTSYGETSYGEGSTYGGGTSYDRTDPYTQPAPGAEYPAYGAGHGQPAPTGPAPKRTGPILTIVLGFLTMLLAPLIGFAMSIAGVAGSAVDVLDQLPQVSAQGGTVPLQAGREYMVVPVDGTSPDSLTQCSVLNPEGEPLALSDTSASATAGAGPSLATTTAGDYTFDCPTGGQLALVDVQDQAFVESVASDLGGSFLPLGIGLVLGLLGLIAGIIGIVWLVKVNKRRRALGY